MTLVYANTVTPAYLLSNVTQNTTYALYLVGQDAAVPPNTQARAGDLSNAAPRFACVLTPARP